MGFTQAISSCFQKYVDFSGRALRSEYWYWSLFTFLGYVIAFIIGAATTGYFLYPIFVLGTFLPSLAVSVRRLHDIDRSGWWLLIGIVPIIGEIVLFIWFVKEGTAGENSFDLARSSRSERGSTREEQRRLQRAQRRAQRLKRIWAIGGAAALVLGAIIAVVILTRGPTAGERVRLQGRQHIAVGASHTPYSSVPATSGPHYTSTAPRRVYSEPLADERLVHNLEHGGIGIHYSCPEGCEDLVKRLVSVGDRFDNIILSPYFNMDTRIALTVWGFLDKFEDFDEARIVDFIEDHIDKGPERVS